MRRFGPKANTPADSLRSEIEWVATPVGQTCGWCDEVFDANDCGFEIPYMGGPAEPRVLYYHTDCQLRQIVGSVAHLRRECSCFVPGSECTDPPQMTLRQAAVEAARVYLSRKKKA